MVDSLDMHAVVGDGEGFRAATTTLLRDFRSGVLTFDRDVVVSVFEASIRVLGGLVSTNTKGGVCVRRRGVALCVLAWWERRKAPKGTPCVPVGDGEAGEKQASRQEACSIGRSASLEWCANASR